MSVRKRELLLSGYRVYVGYDEKFGVYIMVMVIQHCS